jgi:hypothetical protein
MYSKSTFLGGLALKFKYTLKPAMAENKINNTELIF